VFKKTEYNQTVKVQQTAILKNSRKVRVFLFPPASKVFPCVTAQFVLTECDVWESEIVTCAKRKKCLLYDGHKMFSYILMTGIF
jgi:hypothetical protein